VWPDRPQDYAHLHAVDGGYFDNSGLTALTEWLNEALEERAKVNRQPSTPEKILVLQIRGFPEGTVAHSKVNRGWFYQLLRSAFDSTRSLDGRPKPQRDVTELDLLQKYWGTKGIELVSIVFQPDPSVYSKSKDTGQRGVLPLSWHLHGMIRIL
jgi:hypothetical protein